MNQTGSVDGSTQHEVATHVHSDNTPGFLFSLHGKIIFPVTNAPVTTHAKLFSLMHWLWWRAEKTKPTHSSQPAVAPLLVSHTQGASHSRANPLICFSVCQTRLKRTEVHNTKQNEQVEEDRTEKENEDIT